MFILLYNECLKYINGLFMPLHSSKTKKELKGLLGYLLYSRVIIVFATISVGSAKACSTIVVCNIVSVLVSRSPCTALLFTWYSVAAKCTMSLRSSSQVRHSMYGNDTLCLTKPLNLSLCQKLGNTPAFNVLNSSKLRVLCNKCWKSGCSSAVFWKILVESKVRIHNFQQCTVHSLRKNAQYATATSRTIFWITSSYILHQDFLARPFD